MKLVHTAFDGPSAHLIQQLLQDHGIAAVVQGESITSIAPKTPSTFPTVWVTQDDDLARACEVIDAFQKSAAVPAAQRETWICPTCHEEIETQFGACWRCAKESEGAAVVDPAARKMKLALGTSLSLALGCGFLYFFLSQFANVAVQTAETQRRVAQAASLARLAAVLFGIITIYFIARLAGERSTTD